MKQKVVSFILYDNLVCFDKILWNLYCSLLIFDNFLVCLSRVIKLYLWTWALFQVLQLLMDGHYALMLCSCLFNVFFAKHLMCIQPRFGGVTTSYFRQWYAVGSSLKRLILLYKRNCINIFQIYMNYKKVITL